MLPLEKPRERRRTYIPYAVYFSLGLFCYHAVTVLVSLATPMFVQPSENSIKSSDTLPQLDAGRLNLSGWIDGSFKPELTQVQWITTPYSHIEDSGAYVIRDNGFYLARVGLEDRTELFPGDGFELDGKKYTIDELIALPNLEWALLKTNSEKQWRHSSWATYWLYNIKDRRYASLGSGISVCLWLPDLKHVAYVKNNDIHLHDVEADKSKRVTHDGGAQIFNGKPDWVYEEEVWSSDVAMWWAPNSQKLAFVRSDDTKVPIYPLELFVERQKGKVEAYPKVNYLKYPKAGARNPTVSVIVFDISTSKLENVTWTNLEITDHVVVDVCWVDEALLTKVVNRNLTIAEYYFNDDMIHRFETTGWFQLVLTARWIPSNATNHRERHGFLDYLYHDGWKHLAYFAPDREPFLLTSGAWEVTEILGLDLGLNYVYFQLTRGGGTSRKLSKVSLLGTQAKRPKIYDLTKEGYYRGSLSLGGRYLFQTYTGPNIPHQEIIDLRNGQIVAELETNDALKQKLREVSLPKVSVFPLDIPDAELGKSLKVFVKEYLPPNFDSHKRYPLVLAPYGGPYSQLVLQTFGVDFSMVMALQLDAIVIVVDGRGTGFNNLNNIGSNFTYNVKGQLGHYEPMDQILAAEVYAKKNPFVDRSNIAIWGWSFGGFLTLKCLETDVNHVFLYGVAVAPVTLWMFYDTVYTEQFMGLPQENSDGYATALIQNVSNFKGAKRFMVAHGTGDDNVHIQNTYALLDQFNLEEVDNFDLLVFPDSDHGIRYNNANLIIYRRILEFFRRAFHE